MTFKFVSHDPYNTPPSGSRAGWAATISCICSNSIGGNATAIPSTVCAGDNATISVANYSGCTIQWQSSTNNINFTDISGATNATYITPDLTSTTYYRAVVSNNGNCLSANSTVATVIVNQPPQTPVITTNNTSICQGQSTTLNANSSGCIGCSYTWSPATGLNTTTGTSVSANPTSTQNYTVTASNACLPNATSSPVTITVNPLPTANAGSNQTICSGNSVNIGASPVNGSTYIWTPASTLSSSTTANPGANPTSTTTYTLTETITATGCQNSNSVTVSINPLPNGNITGSSTLCSGQSTTSTVTFNSTAGTGPFSVIYSDGSNNTTVAGLSNGGTFNVSPSSTTTYSIISITDANGCTRTTGFVGSSVTITVNTTPNAPNPLQSNSPICAGASLNLTAPFVNGAIYTWTGQGITNPSQQNQVWNNALSGTYTYTCTITENNCTSSQATTSVTVNANPTVSIDGDHYFCIGDSTNLSANAQAGSGTIQGYLWSSNAGTTQSIYVDAPGNYNVTVTNTNSCSSTSATINVIEADTPTEPQITASGNTPLCDGDTLILSASGCQTCTYAWEKDGASVGTGTSYSATQSGSYTVIATNNCGSATSQATIVTFHPNPSVILSADPTSFCSSNGESSTYSATASGGSAPYSYEWTPNNGSNSIISVTTTSTYTVSATDSNGCISLSSNSVSVTDNTPPTPVVTYQVVNDTSIVLHTDLVNGYTYQWYNGNTPIPGATSNDYPNANDCVSYAVEVTNQGCSSLLGIIVCPVSTQEMESSYTFSVYPNPNNGSFIMETQFDFAGDIQIEFTNMLGQIIYFINEKTNIGPYRKEIKLDINDGIYSLLVKTDRAHFSKKIIVDK